MAPQRRAFQTLDPATDPRTSVQIAAKLCPVGVAGSVGGLDKRHAILPKGVGDASVEYFRKVMAGKLVLATAGVALDAGLTCPSFADLPLKEAMIKAAAHVFLVAGSTKTDRSSFARLGDLEVIQSFFTDDGISAAVATAFERRRIKGLIAPRTRSGG